MNRNYTRVLRQFRSLSEQVNDLLASGKWQKLSKSIQRTISEKLKRKFVKLNGIYAGKSLVRILGAAAFLIGINTASGQTTFSSPVINPFGLDSLKDLNVPFLVDIDGDGDLDLFAGDYFGNLNYFENTGSATAPAFGLPDTAAFGLPEFDYFLNPQFADFDGDGDFDLVGGSDTGLIPAFVYVENTGSATAPAFGSITYNPFGLNVSLAGYYLIPAVADLDGDGDVDLLVGTDYGQKIYYENTGTTSMPSFGSGVANPFGLVNNPSAYEAPLAIADVDKDGDMDIMEMEYYQGDFVFYENTGTSTMPAFANPVTNPFSLTGTGAEDFNAPSFGDLDGDGDLDLLVGDYYGAFKYYENVSPVGIRETAEMTGLKVFPTLTTGEVQISLPTSGSFQLLMYNESGQVVEDFGTITSRSRQLYINHSPGLYFLRFRKETGEEEVVKVVKN